MTESTLDLRKIAELASSQPRYFDRPTLTAISQALQLDAMDEEPALTRQQVAKQAYETYLRNGGSTLGPNGRLPGAGGVHDPHFGLSLCDFKPAAPCCLSGLAISCDHNTHRLDLAACTARRVAFLAAADGTAPQIKAQLLSRNNPKHPTKRPRPVLRLSGPDGVEHIVRTDRLDPLVTLPAPDLTAATPLAQLAELLGQTLWGDIGKLAQPHRLVAECCTGSGGLDLGFDLYPRAEWTTEDLGIAIESTSRGDDTMMARISAQGEINGRFGIHPVALAIANRPEPATRQQIKGIFPLAEHLLGALSAIGRSRQSDPERHPYRMIRLRHSFGLRHSGFRLSEHPQDRARIGIQSQILLGISALLDLKMALDISHAIFDEAAAAGRTVLPGQACRQSSSHAIILLCGEGRSGQGEIELTRSPQQSGWSAQGHVTGSIGLFVLCDTRGAGQLCRLAGRAQSSDRAPRLTASLAPPAGAQRRTHPDARLAASLVWDGIRITCKSTASVTGFGLRPRPGCDTDHWLIEEGGELMPGNLL